MNENEIVKVESPLQSAAALVAADGNMDVEKLGKLLEMQERYDATQAKKAYTQAMAAFQAESPKIIKDAQGHNSSYAKLPTVISIVAPELSKNGLSHSWTTKCKDKQIEVTCKITHIHGHCEETSLSAEPDATGSKNSVQALGSTITYLKRYTLEAALGLAEADDDGNAAGEKKTGLPEVTDQNKNAITAICARLRGMITAEWEIEANKVANVFLSETGSYPVSIDKSEAAAKWLIDLKQIDRWATKKEAAKEGTALSNKGEQANNVLTEAFEAFVKEHDPTGLAEFDYNLFVAAATKRWNPLPTGKTAALTIADSINVEDVKEREL